MKYQLIILCTFISGYSLSWHLADETIGYVPDQKILPKSVAWNFLLWDLAPQKGDCVKLAIFDTNLNENQDSLNTTCCNCSNLRCIKRKQFSSQTYNNNQVLSLKMVDFEPQKMDFGKITHGAVSLALLKEIAPNISLDLIIAFDEYGYTSKEHIATILQQLDHTKYDIACFSCAIDTFDPKQDALDYQIAKYIGQFEYIVASSGNKAITKEAFPAQLVDVAFDTGSFNRFHHICSFCQYEKKVGPKFVLPGQDIFITSYQQEYSGTSLSSILMSGLIALLLAEFKDDFSYEQILTVCFLSTYQMDNNDDWQNKVLFGAFDIRTALFCLHILKKLQKDSFLTKETLHKNFSYFVKNILWLCYCDFNDKDTRRLGNFLKKIVKKLSFYAHQKQLDNCSSCIGLFLYQIGANINIKNKKKKIFDKVTIQLLEDSIKHYFQKQNDLLKTDRIQYLINRRTKGKP